MLVADSIKYVYSITLFTSNMITGTVCRLPCSFAFDGLLSEWKLHNPLCLHTVLVISLLVSNVML